MCYHKACAFSLKSVNVKDFKWPSVCISALIGRAQMTAVFWVQKYPSHSWMGVGQRKWVVLHSDRLLQLHGCLPKHH